MSTAVRKLMAALGIALVAVALSSAAAAQCVDINKSGLLHKQSFESLGIGTPQLQNAALEVDPIVGFWKVSLDAGDFNVDSGFVQWHVDGTEIMNSKRAPATGSFCLGTWKRVAPFKYALNHYAISWNEDGSLLGVTSIRESITLAKDGKHYSGSFTITQYDVNGTAIGGVSGDVTAYRINVDTVITHL